MNENLEKAHSIFIHHFGYGPKTPDNIDFDQDAYAEALLKCVEADFDYTIEKYGTVPPTRDEWPKIIID